MVQLHNLKLLLLALIAGRIQESWEYPMSKEDGFHRSTGHVGKLEPRLNSWCCTLVRELCFQALSCWHHIASQSSGSSKKSVAEVPSGLTWSDFTVLSRLELSFGKEKKDRVIFLFEQELSEVPQLHPVASVLVAHSKLVLCLYWKTSSSDDSKLLPAMVPVHHQRRHKFRVAFKNGALAAQWTIRSWLSYVVLLPCKTWKASKMDPWMV